jgi:hypothetical protein
MDPTTRNDPRRFRSPPSSQRRIAAIALALLAACGGTTGMVGCLGGGDSEAPAADGSRDGSGVDGPERDDGGAPTDATAIDRTIPTRPPKQDAVAPSGPEGGNLNSDAPGGPSGGGDALVLTGDSGTLTTLSILAAQGPGCLYDTIADASDDVGHPLPPFMQPGCMVINGCLDPSMQGGTCELLSEAGALPLQHYASALPDNQMCMAIIGTEPVSETTICLNVLSRISTSQCAATGETTPCLCGSTDRNGCLGGTATPMGALYDSYVCDFDTTDSKTIQTDVVVPRFGAGMATGLAQCAAAYSCPCFGYAAAMACPAGDPSCRDH